MEFDNFRNEILKQLEDEADSSKLQEQIELRRQFNEEYPITRLMNMPLEEYVIGTGTKDTFCYQIERGRYKNVGVGVGGSNAVKFGIYYSKKYQAYCIRDVGMKPKIIDDPESYYINFRKELCNFLYEISQTGELDYNIEERYPILLGMGLVLNKLCFLYRPDKFLNTTNKTSDFALRTLGINDIDQIDRVRKANILSNVLRERIPEVNQYDPQSIGNAIYTISENDPKVEKRLDTIKRRTEESEEESETVVGGKNEIYYGTPGCGKSYLVEQKYGNGASSDFSISYRTVFHPDYTNADFIGQVIPSTTADGNIRYDFAPGPFTRALLAAWTHPDQKISLIIDEINRGNAAAIFGDILQLLDRDKDGASAYGIDNKPISDYLVSQGISAAEEEISLPSNLWIIGTMNTSDQNVFPLDTAFKRRWIMKKIRNDFKEGRDAFKNYYVPGTDCTWAEFVTKINAKITRTASFGLNSEDKQIGVFFMTGTELSLEPNNDNPEKKRAFGEKVLMYLWEDVAKLDHSSWFDDKITTLDELLDAFNEVGLKVIKELGISQNDFAEEN